MPTGPPILWAAMLTASTSSSSRGMRPKACTASVCMRAPAACATFAISPTGWTVPTSLLADMTETSAVWGPTSLATASGVTTPERLGRTWRTSNPRPLSAGITSTSESCSKADTTISYRLRSRARMPSAMP